MKKEKQIKVREFKVGDRVRLKKGFEREVSPRFIKKVKVGDEGIVCVEEVEKHEIGFFVGVDFKRNVEGHNCGNHCPKNFGQYVSFKNLELVEAKNSKAKIEDKKEKQIKTILMRIAEKIDYLEKEINEIRDRNYGTPLGNSQEELEELLKEN